MLFCKENRVREHRTGTDTALRHRRQESGMTLLELLIVIAILGLIATLGGVQLMGTFGQTKVKTAQLQIDQLGLAVDLFHLDVGRPPSSEETLIALVKRPQNIVNWNGPYLKSETALLDPWGTLYLYRSPGEHGPYDLYTLGRDREAGGSGEDKDVISW